MLCLGIIGRYIGQKMVVEGGGSKNVQNFPCETATVGPKLHLHLKDFLFVLS